MEPVVFPEMDKSLEVIDKLLSMMDEDMDDMSVCIRGELIDEYLAAVGQAKELLYRIRDNLIMLQPL